MPADEAEAAVVAWRERLGDGVLEVLPTSAATGEGIEELRSALLRHVPLEEETAQPDVAEARHRLYRPGAGDAYRVERVRSGAFLVEGPAVERLVARHDVENPEALRYVEDRLRSMGVIRALERAGFEPGDEVEMAGIVFELDPGAPLR